MPSLEEIENQLALEAESANPGASVNIGPQSSARAAEGALLAALETRTPTLTNEQAQKINRVQKDLGLRFTRGFLDPKKGKKLLEASLKSKFPGSNIVVEDLGGRLAFSIDGSDFALLNPKDGDTIEEVAEQTGRFIEPALDVASAFTPLGPVGGPALVAGAAQAAREGIEAATGDTQPGISRFADIALKSAAAATAGKVGEKLGTALGSLAGRGARALARKAANVDKLSQQAADILFERATRDIENKFIRGINPARFVEKLQTRARDLVETQSRLAKKAFNRGDVLALVESRQPGAPTANLSRTFSDVNPEFVESSSSGLGSNFFKLLKNDLLQAKKKIGADVADLDVGDITFDNLTPFELSRLRTTISNRLNKIRSDDPNFTFLIGAKESIDDAFSSLAPNSRSSQAFLEGIEVIRDLNNTFPPEVQRKFLGKALDFGRADPVTSGELLSKLRGTSFDENELKVFAKASGLTNDPVLQRQATREFLGDFIVNKAGVRGRSGVRINVEDLPDDVVRQAQKFRDPRAIDEAQRRGLRLDPDQFQDIVSAKNIQEGMLPEFNFPAAAGGITRRSRGILGADGFGPGDDLAASVLSDRATFDEGVNLLNEAADLQLAAQNQVRQFGEEPAAFLGRNTLKAAANIPVLNKLAPIIEQSTQAQKLLAQAGTIPQQVPDAIEGLLKTGGALPATLQAGQGIAPNLTFEEMQELLGGTGRDRRILRGGVTFTEGKDKR